jgi:hypothetical protein
VDVYSDGRFIDPDLKFNSRNRDTNCSATEMKIFRSAVEFMVSLPTIRHHFKRQAVLSWASDLEWGFWSSFPILIAKTSIRARNYTPEWRQLTVVPQVPLHIWKRWDATSQPGLQFCFTLSRSLNVPTIRSSEDPNFQDFYIVLKLILYKYPNFI